MEFIRVYTGEDGAAHFASIDPVRSPPWSEGFAVSRCRVRELAVGTVMDWHPAPRRQLIIHLAGQLEIKLRDRNRARLRSSLGTAYGGRHRNGPLDDRTRERACCPSVDASVRVGGRF